MRVLLGRRDAMPGCGARSAARASAVSLSLSTRAARPSPTKPKPSPAPAASKAKAAEAKKPAGKKRKAADGDDGGDTGERALGCHLGDRTDKLIAALSPARARAPRAGFEAGADWEGAGTAGF